MGRFWHRTYRCEWTAEVYPVDQYDRRTNEPPFYDKAFPTYDEAIKHLNEVTEPHAHSTSRRIWKDAPHDYYSAGVRYREVPVTPAKPTNIE